jgi:hypothetical protein
LLTQSPGGRRLGLTLGTANPSALPIIEDGVILGFVATEHPTPEPCGQPATAICRCHRDLPSVESELA